MGKLFRVALVGRPNVGKSTLFNKIIGRRKSLTFRRPGITRDFISEKVIFQDRTFELIDTGGYTSDSVEEITLIVKRQVLRAIEESDLVVFVLDGKDGISTIDREIAEILRKNDKDFIVALNKVDFKKYRDNLPYVYELGFENVSEVSAEHGTGVLGLVEEIASRLKKGVPLEEGTRTFGRVCIVGRPNVGKSTLINGILGQDRIIVSSVPGTTRDSIDTEITFENKKIIFVDTAGIKPRKKTTDDIEKIMSIRSINSIKKSDLAVLVIDMSGGATHNDQQIMRYIIEDKKATVVAANKVDLIERASLPEISEDVIDSFRFASFVPIVPVSAIKKTGLIKLLKTIIGVSEQYGKKVKTSVLNKEAEKFLFTVSIPGSKKPNRAYYITQTGVAPPSFTIFVKYPDRVPESFTRYLSNKIRESFDFRGCPLIMRYRQK